nr:hypothetical protein [Tanacetum cinerariifolium]
MTDAQLKALINQGVANALAACDADRSRNGEDSHDSGTCELALMCARMFPEESDKIKSATSETGLAIWPVTVGVLQIPILLTTKRAPGQVRKLLALSAEPKNISRGSVQS